MTVLPFTTRTPDASAERWRQARLAGTAAVSGSFATPDCGRGTFVGTYRLERFVSQFGMLAAAGVFSGDLLDSKGTLIGTASRRQTAAATVSADVTTMTAALGPIEVNLLGFMVMVDAFDVDVHRTLPAYAAEDSVDAGRHS